MRKIIFLLLLLCLACNSSKEKADLIIYNANIYTVDNAFSNVQAFAVKDGRFLETGTTKSILDTYDATNKQDLKGKTVLPGLIDAHCHFYQLGLNKQKVNLVGTTSFQEVLDRIVAFQTEKNMSFILGRGWDQNDWEVKNFPTRKKLDSLFPDIPVAIERVDGHAYLVNKKALEMAGIDLKTEMSGGEIEVKDGQLTGILVDNPMAMIDSVIPEVDRTTKINALLDAQEECFNYGLTTVNDAGLTKEIIELIDSLQQAGTLDIRMYAMISNYPENLDHFLSKGIIKTDKLNVRSVKVYGDGALGSRGAALKTPYSDKPGHFGAMITPVSEIRSLAERIAATDFQMNTHAIGDSANIVVLKAYKNALKDKTDRRWKVEHAQVVDPVDFDYFNDNILPSVQPTHATSDMYWAEDRLGEERMQGAYAFKTLLTKAGKIALGTDFPVEQVSPFLTFYASIARKDLNDDPKEGFRPQEGLTREETLKGMTIWAAYSNFEENEKGSIEKGKLADFIILEKDILNIPEKEIPELEVLKTYLSGKIVK